VALTDRTFQAVAARTVACDRCQFFACSTPLDEKASSGLPLQPTDLPSLLTEQIAHLRPFLI
ncbi:MAG: hypothetical protein WBZ27_13165, partial [Pseudolabrys sp.]